MSRGDGRVALGVAPQGSHRSVLAQLRHTAPHLMPTLPWRRLVVLLTQSPASMGQPCFPPKLHETLPPSLPGSLRSVPLVHRYYETLRLPSVPLAALRCLRLAIPPLRPVRSQRPDAGPWAGELLCRFPSRALLVETDGSLRFPTPLVSLRPVLGPRWDRTRQAIAACRHGPRMCLRRRLPRGVFRGSIARHWDSLSTLRSEGHPSPRKTRFRLPARLCRAGFVNPQGRDKRSPCSSHFLLSRAFLTQRHPPSGSVGHGPCVCLK